MLIEFGTEWALNQSDEFKVINSLTIPKSKQRLNSVGTLFHASILRRMRTHRHSIQKEFSTVQNSTSRHEGWDGIESHQLLFL
jgi:hypothetical protein